MYFPPLLWGSPPHDPIPQLHAPFSPPTCALSATEKFCRSINNNSSLQYRTIKKEKLRTSNSLERLFTVLDQGWVHATKFADDAKVQVLVNWSLEEQQMIFIKQTEFKENWRYWNQEIRDHRDIASEYGATHITKLEFLRSEHHESLASHAPEPWKQNRWIYCS